MTAQTTETQRHRLRQRADIVLTVSFRLLLTVMLALGTVVVLLQIAGLVTVNASLVEGAADALQPTLFAISAVFGVLTLLLAYVRDEKSDE